MNIADVLALFYSQLATTGTPAYLRATYRPDDVTGSHYVIDFIQDLPSGPYVAYDHSIVEVQVTAWASSLSQALTLDVAGESVLMDSAVKMMTNVLNDLASSATWYGVASTYQIARVK